jgi:hypothetical protein
MADRVMESAANAVVITIDVEWAHDDVLADVRRLLDDHGVRATFFCTHAGIQLPGHECAIHPNFRRTGNSLLASASPETVRDDHSWYRFVAETTLRFCPEAVGVRTHSLFFDSDLLPVFARAGLEYDSSCMLPLTPRLSPVWRGSGIVQLPIFYMDHWDMREGVTGFQPTALPLAQPGLKVLAFHPNLIVLNAATERDYVESRPRYHDPDWLRAHRRDGRGVRTMFLDVLERLAHGDPPPVLAEVNARWRAAAPAAGARAAPGAARGDAA